MERRDVSVILRLTKKERRAMSQAARRLGMSRESWIRLHLGNALKQESAERPSEAA